jgi:hypothetical protein
MAGTDNFTWSLKPRELDQVEGLPYEYYAEESERI